MMRLGKPMGGWWILYCLLRMIGRVAFPIFCFLLLEGFLHTRDWRRYALRLGVFAVVSEIPFDLMGAHVPMSWDVQNVFFTLFLGLLMMKALETVGAVDLWKPGSAQMPLKTLLQLAVILLFCGAASVSYTHLDVYKRQNGNHAAGLTIYDKLKGRLVPCRCLLYTSRCV